VYAVTNYGELSEFQVYFRRWVPFHKSPVPTRTPSINNKRSTVTCVTHALPDVRNYKWYIGGTYMHRVPRNNGKPTIGISSTYIYRISLYTIFVVVVMLRDYV